MLDMNRLYSFPRQMSNSLAVRLISLNRCAFSGTSPGSSCHSSQNKQPNLSSGSGKQNEMLKNASSITLPSSSNRSMLSLPFWTCRSTWRRSGLNTLRCLVGCTIGDFSALWMLQSYYPELGMNTIMVLSMVSGITTSIMLETVLLRRGPDNMSWKRAAQTAMGMSMVSMVAMELAENAVDYHLTGGVVAFEDPKFWIAALLSVTAGFLAPLPYNYARLRKYGRTCH
ncbi:hypothetical protein BGW36DRAFT_370200 [Talaromyces proteolyticus]|uniref:DUF4396 domain-containing protein n=1 Tax=Talaromyces proteolyticus TaxID=1131652 RepID=A0AAD4KZG9_9EURO|nr:uncharacterized protein BGW36DRAFT_370200 [Talaromyces proteolyticus]KAH8703897.1 hypothetical protein BGW36DRAFT_370200 [Talaromyces proteolyticus]